VPQRPNPFLDRKLLRPSIVPQTLSPFQRARDWTAFIVSLTSLLTALIALRNTLTGPRPFLAQMADDTITILRSDQFVLGNPPTAGLVLRDETGTQVDFPLVIVQPTLANRAAPPNGVGVRGIEGDLAFSRAGQTLFRTSYLWYRATASSTTPDSATKVDRISFESAVQTAPFDLPGGSTWSRELLLVPRQTWGAMSWDPLVGQIVQNCLQQPELCMGEFTIRVRLDNGQSLTELCNFHLDEHVIAHLQGVERRYFSSPVCSSPTTH
jgi:hypothetical protein